MNLSSANKSEIQPDLSDKAFKHLASYTQLEKLTRDIDGLKLVIFDLLKTNEKATVIEDLITKYEIRLKKLSGYGIATYTYQQYLSEMFSQLEKLQK